MDSNRFIARARLCAAIVLIALAGASCSKSAEQNFADGNRYFANKQYGDAILEYRNAVQKNPKYGEALLKLADAYAAAGDTRNAFRYYIRAADSLPKNVDLQVKAATMLLLGGQFLDAKARAKQALAVDPKNVEAQIVIGNAAAGLKDLDDAITQVEAAINMDPNAPRAYTSLGSFQAAKGNNEEAEAAFKKAVDLDAKSANPRLALAQFYWATDRPDAAEQTLIAALQLEPRNVLANRFAATFYLSSKRPTEAEKYLKAIVDITGMTASRVTLADYYVLTNRPDDAIRMLQEVAADKNWHGTAMARIAGIQYSHGKQAEAHKTIDAVLAREPRNAEALLVKGRFLANENRLDEALVAAKAASEADPRSAQARYLLGTIYVGLNDTEEATDAFNEVLKLNPRAAAAELQLSRLQLAAGATESALQSAERAVDASPNSVDAHLALARSLTARHELTRAQADVEALLAKHPNNAAVHTQMGIILGLNKDLAGSRRELNRALQIDADSYEAVQALVAVAIAEKKVPEAQALVDSRLARTPNSGPLLLLSARLYATIGDMAKAEQSLQKAIEVAPSNLESYGVLVQLYVLQHKLDQAVAELQVLAKRQKKPIGAETMIGMILQVQNRTAEAQKQYEKVLALDARAPVASNNLAWLYAENGGNLDVALQLARTAKEQLPDMPEVNDTLGWVYYKKDLPAMAVPLLMQAVEKNPKSADYQYHLGMASLKNNDLGRAKQSLEQALQLNPNLDGATEARQALASIK